MFIILRVTTLLGSLLRAAPPCNDLFFTSHRALPRRHSALLRAAQLNSTICLFLRSAAQLIASPRLSTQRFVCFSASLRVATNRISPRLNSTQLNDLLVTTLRRDLLCILALRIATLLNSTQLNDLFVTSPRHSALLRAPQPLLRATLLNSTICFLLRVASQLVASQLPSTQRNRYL